MATMQNGSCSLEEISRQVGVSIATVSRVLNNSPRVSPRTRQLVLKAINEKRRVRGPQAGPVIVGVEVPSFHEDRMNNLYIQEVFAGLLQSARSYSIAFRPVDLAAQRRPGEPYHELVMRLGLEGLLHLGASNRFLPAIEEIAEAGFPQYVIGTPVDIEGVSWVDSENVESTRKGIHYLLGLGHTRIGAICPPMLRTHEERLEGYRRALAEMNLPQDPDLVVKRRSAGVEDGVNAALHLLTRADRPTAIYFAEMEMAFGGLHACRQMNLRVPEDVSILSIGDSRLIEFISPKLTIIKQPVFEMALRAGQTLAEEIQHKDHHVHQEYLPCDLFINETTGPVKT
ncbi:MAG: LacI family DNA-binding transcriptional regulator [Phycisphaerae bacterium]|nr:LacI family DNA-binding transcriptional regulator [Phycisphaerae bacterium]